MKIRLLAALCLLGAIGCGSSGSTDSKLVGQWLYTNADGSAGIGLSFKADGTYSTVLLRQTSGTTANTQVENGGYMATDTSITFTPTESSCAGSDAPTTSGYVINGNVLSLTMPTGLVSFVRNTTPPSSGVILTVGCFAADGTFTAQPVGPVTSTQDDCYVAPDWNIGYQDCGVATCVANCGVLPQDGSIGHTLPVGCSVSIGTSTPRTAVCRATCADCM